MSMEEPEKNIVASAGTGSTEPTLPLLKDTYNMALIKASDHPPLMNQPGVWVRSGRCYKNLAQPNRQKRSGVI